MFNWMTSHAALEYGAGRHPIKGIRKSIIINSVTSDWREKGALA